jgi:hypothetical protein
MSELGQYFAALDNYNMVTQFKNSSNERPSVPIDCLWVSIS